MLIGGIIGAGLYVFYLAFLDGWLHILPLDLVIRSIISGGIVTIMVAIFVGIGIFLFLGARYLGYSAFSEPLSETREHALEQAYMRMSIDSYLRERYSRGEDPFFDRARAAWLERMRERDYSP